MGTTKNQLLQYGLIFGKIEITVYENSKDWWANTSGFANSVWFYFDTKVFNGRKSFAEFAKCAKGLGSGVKVTYEVISSDGTSNEDATYEDCLEILKTYKK